MLLLLVISTLEFSHLRQLFLVLAEKISGTSVFSWDYLHSKPVLSVSWVLKMILNKIVIKRVD